MIIDFGLGSFNNAELTDNLQHIMGNDIKISYKSPQAAAGMSATPVEYAKFLRRF